jgi:protein phosphatase PTC1
MEDAHSYVFDYDGVHGQGFFAVFDGHAGREAADWCGKNFHQVSLESPYSTMFVMSSL